MKLVVRAAIVTGMSEIVVHSMNADRVKTAQSARISTEFLSKEAEVMSVGKICSRTVDLAESNEPVHVAAQRMHAT